MCLIKIPRFVLRCPPFSLSLPLLNKNILVVNKSLRDILCVAAVLISVVSLIISVARNYTYDVDYPSLLVSVLSVIVTILIGWQVVNYVLMEKHIKNTLDESLKAVTKDYEAILNGIVRLNLYNHDLKGNCALLTDNCFECLKDIAECRNENLRRFATNAVMEILYELRKHYKCNYEIYAGRKNRYLYILSKTDSPYTRDIEKAIAHTTEVSDSDRSKIDFAEPMSGKDVFEAAVAAGLLSDVDKTSSH